MSEKHALSRQKLGRYLTLTEKILFSSLKKMKQMSELGLIDYVLLKCA